MDNSFSNHWSHVTQFFTLFVFIWPLSIVYCCCCYISYLIIIIITDCVCVCPTCEYCIVCDLFSLLLLILSLIIIKINCHHHHNHCHMIYSGLICYRIFNDMTEKKNSNFNYFIFKNKPTDYNRFNNNNNIDQLFDFVKRSVWIYKRVQNYPMITERNWKFFNFFFATMNSSSLSMLLICYYYYYYHCYCWTSLKPKFLSIFVEMEKFWNNFLHSLNHNNNNIYILMMYKIRIQLMMMMLVMIKRFGLGWVGKRRRRKKKRKKERHVSQYFHSLFFFFHNNVFLFLQ